MLTLTRNPDLKVRGVFLLGLFGSIEERSVAPFREKHGLTAIEPDEWYALSKIQALFEDIEQSPSGMFNLVAVGMEMMKYLPFPPEVTTPEAAIRMLPQMGKETLSDANALQIEIQFLGERHVMLTQRNPIFPPDLIYGFGYGMVRRFAPKGSQINVHQQLVDEHTLTHEIKW